MGIAKPKTLKAIAFGILILAIVAQPILIVVSQLNIFFTRNYSQRHESLRNAYYNSQYVKKDRPGIILDESLESFAAGEFLSGLNPILIVHDQPPLGRYIMAASIFLFDNPNTLILPLIILSVVALFGIAETIFKSIPLAFISLAIFLNEPRFLNIFLHSPLLESVQFPFIVFAIYFFIKGILEKSSTRWFILTAIMLGFVISIRFFILGAVLLFSFLSYFALYERKVSRKAFTFVVFLPIALIVLLLSYTKTILLGYNPWQIFGIQKYIFFYHQSKFVLPFSFWDLLLFNKWHTWWGDRSISSDPQWTIFWPIAMVLSLCFTVVGIMKKIAIGKAEAIILLWSIFYSIMLSAGYTSTRYFLPVLPFLYILALSFLLKIAKKVTL